MVFRIVIRTSIGTYQAILSLDNLIPLSPLAADGEGERGPGTFGLQASWSVTDILPVLGSIWSDTG